MLLYKYIDYLSVSALIVVNYESMNRKIWSHRNILHYVWVNLKCLQADRWSTRKFLSYKRITLPFGSSQSHVMRTPSACVHTQEVLCINCSRKCQRKKEDNFVNKNPVKYPENSKIIEKKNTRILETNENEKKIEKRKNKKDNRYLF